MPVSRLLREQTIGETRWVALDARDVPVSLYLERAIDAARAVIGERLSARVRRMDAGPGGAFVDLGPKGEGFLRLKADTKLTEGALVDVDVSAEARRGKLARVRMAGAEPSLSGVACWRASLEGGVEASVEERAAGDSEIQSAFEDALAASVTPARPALPGSNPIRSHSPRKIGIMMTMRPVLDGMIRHSTAATSVTPQRMPK